MRTRDLPDPGQLCHPFITGAGLLFHAFCALKGYHGAMVACSSGVGHLAGGGSAPAAPGELRRLFQRLAQRLLRIGNLLDPLPGWERQRRLASGLASSHPDRLLIAEEPGFQRAHRYDADRRRLVRRVAQGPLDFLHPMGPSDPIPVTMDEQKVAGVKIQADPNLFFQSSGRSGKTAEVGPLTLKDSRGVLAQTPGQDGQQCAVRRAFGQESEIEAAHDALAVSGTGR